MRNRFIHRINRDIPEQVKKVISKMICSIANNENIVTDQFVDASLSSLATLVKTIELAYIDFYESKAV